MRQYEAFELTFSGKALPDRWAAIDLTATFTCGGETKTDGEETEVITEETEITIEKAETEAEE